MDYGTLNVLDGQLPAKVRGLVEEWAKVESSGVVNLEL